MSPGFVQILQLLLGLTGFGLQPNPKPPTPDQVLEFAVPDADAVVYLDAASIVPGNFKVLQHLPDDPHVRATPELAKQIRDGITQLEGMRGMVKMASGVDVVNDISDVTMFVHFTKPDDHPDVLMVVHGKLAPSEIDAIARMQGGTPTTTAAGAEQLDTPNGESFAITKAGVLLGGSTALVKARVAATWKSPARPAGGTLARTADVIAEQPVFALAWSLTPAARKHVLAQMKPDNFGSDLIARGKGGTFAIFHDGIGWTWTDSTRAGLDAMAMVSDGVMDLFRAGQLVPRAAAKIVLGGLESYRRDKHVAELLAHKDDVMKLVGSYTGDGQFAVKLDKDPRTLTLTLRATGKSFSDVVPLGAAVPVIALGTLWFARHAQSESMPTTVERVEAVPPVRATPTPPPHR